MNCGVGCRHGSDPMLLLLWLYHRLAATAPIGRLAWEHPHAAGAAQEMAKRQKKKKKNRNKRTDLKIKLMVTKMVGGRDKLGVWN